MESISAGGSRACCAADAERYFGIRRLAESVRANDRDPLSTLSTFEATVSHRSDLFLLQVRRCPSRAMSEILLAETALAGS